MTTRLERAERFARLLDHYEADGPDCTVPGASKDGRWAIVTEREGARFVNRAGTREDCERVAAEGLSPIEGPVCIHDLDELVGEEPMPGEGDIVHYTPSDACHDDCRHPNLDHLADGEPCRDSQDRNLTTYRVARIDEELIEGEVAHFLILNEVGGMNDREDGGWDDYDERVYWDEVAILERDEPDERLPVRYDLAKVTTIVAFNTVASP